MLVQLYQINMYGNELYIGVFFNVQLRETHVLISGDISKNRGCSIYLSFVTDSSITKILNAIREDFLKLRFFPASVLLLTMRFCEYIATAVVVIWSRFICVCFNVDSRYCIDNQIIVRPDVSCRRIQ